MADRVKPPRIPGRSVDPPPKNPADTLAKIHEPSPLAALGFRAFLRFSLARASLLAAGTAYPFVFLSMFALVALAFGISLRIGSADLAKAVSDALSNAFPSLVREGVLDPTNLQSLGASASIGTRTSDG